MFMFLQIDQKGQCVREGECSASALSLLIFLCCWILPSWLFLLPPVQTLCPSITVSFIVIYLHLWHNVSTVSCFPFISIFFSLSLSHSLFLCLYLSIPLVRLGCRPCTAHGAIRSASSRNWTLSPPAVPLTKLPWCWPAFPTHTRLKSSRSLCLLSLVILTLLAT